MSQFNPKFLYKNKILSASQISDSAGTSDSNKIKLFDRNYETQYYGIGETSGTRTITIIVTSEITNIFLQNINWKNFTIKYDTSSTFSTPIAVTNNTESDLFFEFDSVTPTSNIAISVTQTMSSGDVLKCGQIYIGKQIFEMDNPGGSYRIEPVTKQKILELSDGSYFKNYIRSIKNFNLQIKCVSDDERLNYKAVFDVNRRDTFVFIPRPATSPDVWDGVGGHYHWGNAPDFDNYTDDLFANGYDVNMQLIQAGGVG